MTRADRNRVTRELLAGVRESMRKIADAAPDHWNGHQLRIALLVVVNDQYKVVTDVKAYRRMTNEVKQFLYNHNLA